MASNCSISLDVSAGALMGRALELARIGLLPVGSHANKHYCDKTVMFQPSLDPVLIDLMFDAQTSGGLVLSIPGKIAEDVRIWLESRGEMAALIGSVESLRTDGKRLVLC